MNNDTIHTFIKGHPCAALATQGEGGELNLAHVFVLADEAFNLYFISRPEHRKAVNILERKQVAFMFSDKETIEQVEYIGEAVAIDEVEEVTDQIVKLQEIMSTHKTNYWVPPVSQIDGEGYMVLKATPKKVVYRQYIESGATGEMQEYKVDLG